jgi:site-specific recombinase XerD
LKEKYWVIEQENISPKNREAANEYLLDRKLDGEHSVATIDRYRRVLETLFSECPKNLDEMAPEDVKAWLDAHDKYKARTIYLVLSVLSDFSNFCQEEGYLDHRLMKSRWFPSLPDSLPMYLDSHEFARARLNAEDMPLRDRALVSFLFSSGCRRGEVYGLNIESIDLENGTATVVGKGGGKRQVHFNEETALLLKKYLSSRPGDDPALFLSQYGKRLGPISIYGITTKLGKKSGLKLSPHRCRHTFATNLLSRGAKLEFIKDELGHKKINTTLIYARVPSPELISEYRRIME